jgi:hypothetical protein
MGGQDTDMRAVMQLRRSPGTTRPPWTGRDQPASPAVLGGVPKQAHFD